LPHLLETTLKIIADHSKLYDKASYPTLIQRDWSNNW